MTESGIPDLHGLYDGVDFWIECKQTKGWAVVIRPTQIAWLLRRVRNDGRCFIAVRRKGDELWLIEGSSVKGLATRGLPRGKLWMGGPSGWDWPSVLAHLTDG